MQSASVVDNTGHETYAALAHSERLLLWACRTWAAWVGAGHCPLCPIEHEFGPLGIADAASALHALMCGWSRQFGKREMKSVCCVRRQLPNRVNSNPRLLTCRSGCRLLKPTWRSSHCVLSLRLSRASG